MYTMYCAIDHTIEDERYYLHLLPDEVFKKIAKEKKASRSINIKFRENKLLTKKFSGKCSQILAQIKDWLIVVTNDEINSVLKEPIEAAYLITRSLEKTSTIETLWRENEDYRSVNKIIEANCNETAPTKQDLLFLKQLLEKTLHALIDKRLEELEKKLRAGFVEYYPLDEYKIVK